MSISVNGERIDGVVCGICENPEYVYYVFDGSLLMPNYENYSFSEMTEWLTGLFNTSNREAMKSLYYTLVSQPTNYMNYYFGYLEIEELAKEAKAALGSKFSYKDFHRFILKNGDAPFYVIREHLKKWLK